MQTNAKSARTQKVETIQKMQIFPRMQRMHILQAVQRPQKRHTFENGKMWKNKKIAKIIQRL